MHVYAIVIGHEKVNLLYAQTILLHSHETLLRSHRIIIAFTWNILSFIQNIYWVSNGLSSTFSCPFPATIKLAYSRQNIFYDVIFESTSPVFGKTTN